MQHHHALLPPRPPVWEPVTPRTPAPDAGTPIYDALLRLWHERGHHLPGPRHEENRPPHPEIPFPGSSTRGTSWWD